MIRLTELAEQKIKEKIKSENANIKIPESSGIKLKITNDRLHGHLKSNPEINDKIICSKTTKGIKFFINTEVEELIQKKLYRSILIGWIGGKDSEEFIIEDWEPRSHQDSRLEVKSQKKGG